MGINSHSLSGADLLNPSGGRSSANKDIFVTSKNGGAGRARKPEPAPEEPAEDLIPEPTAAPPPKTFPVKLTNPKFLVESGQFDQKVAFTCDAELPPELKEIKRVIVTAFALSQNGKREQIFSKDFYIDEGKVKGEIELRRPGKQDGKEVEACPVVFTAKHRDSKEVESPRIQVKGKAAGNDELILEVPGSAGLAKEGFAMVLKSTDGSIVAKLELKSGEEKKGDITLKFTMLDPKLRYSMDMLDSKGAVAETIFKNVGFGKWDEAVA